MKQPQSEQDKRYKRAKEQAAKLKRFYTHLTVYVVVIAFLFFIDWSDGGNWWFYWPAIGWGIAVAIQGASIIIFSAGWKERTIREIMEKEEKK
ncbi:2TM domain-containing protein [Patescibacteria group bacterium]|nr:2TM domain-containing protein [Patescibacteria group bacterium]